MTMKKFDQVARPDKPLTVDDIPEESVKQAWLGYEHKSEYKEFNKHDLINSLLEDAKKEK